MSNDAIATLGGVKDIRLEPVDQASSSVGQVIDLAALAANPAVDVDKLERLIALRERDQNRSAEEAFNVAFMKMSEELPVINERGQILGKGNTVQSSYAKFEDMQRILMPIMRRHGFNISYSTEWPSLDVALITGILTHKAGHSRKSSFASKADTSGAKNAVQGLGSAVSYGRRYTMIDLLNIVTIGQDDDAAAAGRQGVKEPDGFEQQWIDIQIIAEDGMAALTDAWKALKPAIRDHAFKHYRLDWEKLKKSAARVDLERKERDA